VGLDSAQTMLGVAWHELVVSGAPLCEDKGLDTIGSK
jgi:hypothetical protein